MSGAFRRLDVSRVLASARSPAVLASVAAPLVGIGAAVAAGIVSPERMMAAWSVRLWLAALAAGVALGIAAAIEGRRLASALGLLAVAAVVAQALASAALRFEGTLSAGAGESGAPWESREGGPLARAPAVEVVDVPIDPAGSARLRVDGRDVSLPLGKTVEVGGGTSLTVHGPFPAPSFEVLGADGAPVENGLVKIDPAKHDWFMVGFLPHRLYLSIPEGGPGPDPRAPERLHLRVQRGKIRVLDREVLPGERVAFERLSFAFGRGDLWARVEVRRRTPVWPGFSLAAALAAGALALQAAARRARD